MTTFPRQGSAVLHPAAGVRLLGRAAALLALGSAVVHLLLADLTTLGSLAMLGMALACLPCAWHLWRDPSGSVWAMTAAVDTAMLVVHLQMLAPQSGHAHAATPAPLMWLGLGLVAAQLVAAALAAAATRR